MASAAIRYTLGDDIGNITLIDWMGGDGPIVNRARKCYQSQERSTPESDAKLLTRLVGSKPLHGTTLRSTAMTFDVKAPLDIVFQWTRHLAGHEFAGMQAWYAGTDTIDIGGAFDQQSLRYVDVSSAQFYTPPADRFQFDQIWAGAIVDCMDHYQQLRNLGAPKELARTFVPGCIYVQFEWTCNLQAFFDWYGKRAVGGGAQWELTRYAEAAWDLVAQNVAPEACAAWKSSER